MVSYEYPNFKEVKRGSVYQWNDIYFLCADYMMLKKFASELKRKWIKDKEKGYILLQTRKNEDRIYSNKTRSTFALFIL